MAHPFNEHRNHKVQKDRVGKMTAGYSNGVGHSDAAQDKAMIQKMVKPVALRADGGAVKPRADRPARAKGGRVKGTNINIIVAPKAADAPVAPPVPPMPPKPPMAPPAAAAPAPPMGLPPGLGGMPPPMPPGPPRSEGGRAYKKGGAVTIAKGFTQVQHSGNKSDGQNIGRGPVITRNSGGRTSNEYADRIARGEDGRGSNVRLPISPKRLEELMKPVTPTPGRATGGPINADGRKGKQMAWLKGVGAGGGKGRLKKAHHRNKA